MVDINDIGLQLSAMLQQGKRLTPAVAKMLQMRLKRDISDPKSQRIYEEGRAAFMAGESFAGPYESGTWMDNMWSLGWNDAAAEAGQPSGW